ncbi:hypothetical protein V5F59_22475 [Xanthobacter autotrophicus DSM 431]|uniref:hypothetical protein n=1 Tax=Xanthobacter nonsaccharivorans TaxID=3119912 RepID=UPI003728CF2A
MTPSPKAGTPAGLSESLFLYLSVALVTGAVIALQISIMRLFSVGSWAHFGSLVVSLAMLGFGLASAVMCIGKDWFETRWRGAAGTALVLFGPLMIVCNLTAQQLPFNAIFLISDPMQKWRLVANFVLYFLPFLAGAFFLGVVFLKAASFFNRVYFADLTGSGVCGLLFLLTLYRLPPEDLILVPLGLWFVGSALWFAAVRDRTGGLALVAAAVLAAAGHLVAPQALGLTKLAVSDYKGVSYARKFPDAKLVYRSHSPFGLMEVYGSSYLHFAPGLSDSAAFNLPEMPKDAFLGLYMDGEGPSGIMRKLPTEQTAYFRYLPMAYPFLIRPDADTFVVQFGGGISTEVALRSGSRSVTVAEGNPAVLDAFETDPALRAFTGDILHDPKVKVIPQDGRLHLAYTPARYDIIDLSLADSAGLSSPGGFAIVEKFSYSEEAMAAYMRALKPGGILSVTLWNKEEPPKSVLKLYATMAAAARTFSPDISGRFFVVSSYLSTATVLYKNGAFTPEEIATLRAQTRALSFDEIYYPGASFDLSGADGVVAAYRNQIFSTDGPPKDPVADASGDPTAGPAPDAEGEPVDGPADASAQVLPSTTLGRLAWFHLVSNSWSEMERAYVFDARPLTNVRPYFAAYVKPADLARVTDRLELFQDEWGYLLLWATLAIAAAAAAVLIALPVIFGWRTIFSRYPGKLSTILYFACLGLGYIMVEVGLISFFISALGNPTVSASVLITGMLVFSGFGSLVSERVLPVARSAMPKIFLAIGAILIGYGLAIDRVIALIGTLPYGLRMVLCFALIFPPAFLMGFPMATAMGTLDRLGKHHMFLWAWGINGSFSVVGAAAVPIVATLFGLDKVLILCGLAYLVAMPAFFGVLLPLAKDELPDTPAAAAKAA